jgi:NAD+ synthase (glutamine-hydrolysing)
VACRAFDALGEPRNKIKAFTMPGFGTTSRTLQNARALMRHLDVTAMEADIRALCLEEMKALKHKPFGIDLTGLDVEQLTRRFRDLKPESCHDLVFENVQARMRTSILMNAGFVIGTGDVSELALGWCTYNADHMSMYNPNISIPKTLVRFLVKWAAENEFEGEAQHTLLDIVATTISPELLPTGDDGQSTQATESTIGPYELHDFFLFHFLRYGSPPEKILYLAEQAKFDSDYTPVELRHWLRVFLTRFFANQFKRSCLPDGPKVGSISLSPRGDWRMPSDAQAALWLERLSKE